ncbi:MAG: low specificity L-threonine aldolase, partial [Calditrichaeota bacterium]|nr:low specificity L-threonine aldolase [Calditrichota bacterium]
LRFLEAANQGHSSAYGNDNYTQSVIERINRLFGGECSVYFVFNGTAANVLSLQSLIKPYEAVICPETAHINIDECGAPEKHLGSKVRSIKTATGKLNPELIEPFLIREGDEHYSQNRVISITQSTEYGTVYSVSELKELADFAHRHNLYLHVDGARIANAIVSTDSTFKAMITDTGIDVLSFGGTKNGMMFGEAVVFLRKELAPDFKFLRKQAMQLASKMRFIAAQFDALLTDNLYFSSAAHANAMAQYLADGLAQFKGIKITQPVEANAVFAIFPQHIIKSLQAEYFFYVWNESTNEVRLMNTFDTKREDIDQFLYLIKTHL